MKKIFTFSIFVLLFFCVGNVKVYGQGDESDDSYYDDSDDGDDYYNSDDWSNEDYEDACASWGCDDNGDGYCINCSDGDTADVDPLGPITTASGNDDDDDDPDDPDDPEEEEDDDDDDDNEDDDDDYDDGEDEDDDDDGNTPIKSSQQDPNGKEYDPQDGDKLISEKFPKTMTPQKPKTCVTASLEYISKILGKEIKEKDFHLYQLIKHKSPVHIYGVKSSHVAGLINYFFTPISNISLTEAIDKGYPVMIGYKTGERDIITGEEIGHNIVVVGYQANGDLIYMDPSTGDLMERPSSEIKPKIVYVTPITETK